MEFLAAIIIAVILTKIWRAIAEWVGKGLGFDRLIRSILDKSGR